MKSSGWRYKNYKGACMAQRRIFQWFFTVIIFTSGIALSIYTYQGVRKSDEAKMLAELQQETYEQQGEIVNVL